MVRVITKEYIDGRRYAVVTCSEDDTKPTTNFVQGSECIETDTGKFYLFNEDTSDWDYQCTIKEEE